MMAMTGSVKMLGSLIMGLVLPAGLTRTGPDYVSAPGFRRPLRHDHVVHATGRAGVT
jgi:hypothetical protein